MFILISFCTAISDRRMFPLYNFSQLFSISVGPLKVSHLTFSSTGRIAEANCKIVVQCKVDMRCGGQVQLL